MSAPQKTESLFNLAKDARELEELLADPELEFESSQVEKAIEDMIIDAHGKLSTKLDNYVGLIREFETRALVRKQESARIKKKQKTDEKKAEQLIARMMQVMLLFKFQAAETLRYTIRINNKGGVLPLKLKEGVKPEDLPEEFQKKETVITADNEGLRLKLESADPDDPIHKFAELEKRGKYVSIK